MINLIGKFARLPGRDRALLAEAAAALGLARFAVLALPFRWLVHARRYDAGASPPAGAEEERIVERVGWAVATMGRFTPWDSNCLARALAARQMLRRRGVGSTLHLGVVKPAPDSLKAHAWLSAGDRIVTGARGREAYTEVSTFPR